MHLFKGENLFNLYKEFSSLVVEEGIRKSDMNEVQDVIVNYSHTSQDFENFSQIIQHIQNLDNFRYGAEKAGRAYGSFQGNITKPGYRHRMESFPFIRSGSNSYEPLNQFEILTEQFREMPQASNLAISIFHPSDIQDAYRPGYVPCLSFIDLKYRSGYLATKFFFRSCDVDEVAIFDLYHCVKMSHFFRNMFSEARPDLEISVNNVIWYFSRAFTYKRKRERFAFLRDL